MYAKHDSNVNSTSDKDCNTFVNRLVEVLDGTTGLVSYAYDALGRRTERTQDSETTDFYYSDKWQVLEERVSGNAHAQYVWSPVYVDALIVRDRDADSSSGNGLEERVFVLQDANWNVTAIANAAGSVLERYVYDPYGAPTRLTASWGTPSGDTYNWVYLHQGGRYEAATGLYNFRMREYSPTLGRWMSVDPFQYVDSLDLYVYVRNSPEVNLDPSGGFIVGMPSWSADALELFLFGGMAKIIPRPRYRLGKGPPPDRSNTIMCDGKGNAVVHIQKDLPPEYEKCGIKHCMTLHEKSHLNDLLTSVHKDICKGVKTPTIILPEAGSGPAYRMSEIKAHRAEIKCYEALLKDKDCKPECAKLINTELTKTRDRLRGWQNSP